MRSIGMDWLVRLVSPRAARRPRGDSARVKLNMPITRVPIMLTRPMAIGMSAARANGTTSRILVMMNSTTRPKTAISHSLERRKLPIRRSGLTTTRRWSAALRSVKTPAAGPRSSPMRARWPWARVSR